MFTETTAALDLIESTITGGDVDDAQWQAADDLLGRIASILDAARGQVVEFPTHWVGIDARREAGDRSPCSVPI
jgi:hypothetical protein